MTTFNYNVAVTVYLKTDTDFKFDPNNFHLSEYTAEYSALLPHTTITPDFWEKTFESGNVGALRDHLSRSLSVGDFIQFQDMTTNRPGLVMVVLESGWGDYLYG